MKAQARANPFHWTVTVTGRSARGLLRDFTSYRTEEDRLDAECAAYDETRRRWPASTKPMKISSYKSAHVVRPDQDWRELCHWQERELNSEAQHDTRRAHRHNGRDYLLDKNGRCWFCQQIVDQEQEKSMEAVKDLPSSEDLALPVTVTANGESVKTTLGGPQRLAQADWQADPETGEVRPTFQPTLDATMFPAIERRAVPMVKISLGGTVEMTQADWQAYCDQGLEPGRVVKLTLTGYLPNPHAKWVKRTETERDPVTNRKETNTWWEQEGQIKVKALEIGSFELKGVYEDGE